MNNYSKVFKKVTIKYIENRPQEILKTTLQYK